MPDGFLVAAATAFAVVFLAEMGDKSQFVLLAQAARHPPWRVLAEALAAFAVLVALAVTAGAAAARFLPGWLVAVASGLLLLAFGILALREAREEREREGREDDAAGTRDPLGSRRGGTFVLVLLSEMGDKTQLAAAALAGAGGRAWATGLGAFAGEAAASLLAVLAGAWVARHVSPRRRALGSGLLFLLLGVATLAWGVWQALA